jgi:hypothetical protein
MLTAHGGAVCPLEVWAALGALSAAGGARVLWAWARFRAETFFGGE